MPNNNSIELPNDVSVLCFMSNGFMQDFFIAQRDEIIARPCHSGVLLIVDGTPMGNHQYFTDGDPEYQMLSYSFVNACTIPMKYYTDNRSAAQRLARTVRMLYDFTVSQKIKFNVSNSIGFQQLESLFGFKHWARPERWITSAWMDYTDWRTKA